MGDPSFPNGYWETFREVVKATRPNALMISETWQKDSTLLRMLRGDRVDTTMNYRFRDAVIGVPRPGQLRLQGLRRQRALIPAVGLPRPPGLHPRGLPGRGLLLGDEPARQPRHGAAPVDAHAGRRDDAPRGTERGQRRRRQAARAARLADPVHHPRRADRLLRRRGRRSPATTTPTTAAPTRGPTSAARPTPRSSPTTRPWPPRAATSRSCATATSRRSSPTMTTASRRTAGRPARRRRSSS